MNHGNSMGRTKRVEVRTVTAKPTPGMEPETQSPEAQSFLKELSRECRESCVTIPSPPVIYTVMVYHILEGCSLGLKDSKLLYPAWYTRSYPPIYKLHNYSGPQNVAAQLTLANKPRE